jgi:hypothetical protein
MEASSNDAPQKKDSIGISVSGALQVVNGKQASPDSQSSVELHGLVQSEDASSKDVPQKKVLLSLQGV